jgi:2-iminobutanoate/2-iminopropanoate deaminase
MIDYRGNADGAVSPLPFSPATVVGNLIFVSGQASTDRGGAIVADSFEEEFRRSIENLRRILREAGTDLNRVVQIRAYVRDPMQLGLYNQLYREYFTAPYPARTTLTHCLPDSLQFEVDCVAVIPPPE